MYESPCSPPFCDFVFCDWQPNDRSSPQDSASLKMESFVEPTHPLSNWSRRNSKKFMSHRGSTNKGKVLRSWEQVKRISKRLNEPLHCSCHWRHKDVPMWWECGLWLRWWLYGLPHHHLHAVSLKLRKRCKMQLNICICSTLNINYHVLPPMPTPVCLYIEMVPLLIVFYGVVCLSEDFGYRKVSISSTTQ